MNISNEEYECIQNNISINTITCQLHIKTDVEKLNFIDIANKFEFNNKIVGLKYSYFTDEIIGKETIPYGINKYSTKTIKRANVIKKGVPTNKKCRRLLLKGDDKYYTEEEQKKPFLHAMFISINTNYKNYDLYDILEKNGEIYDKYLVHAKIFVNGNIQLTGCKSDNDISIASEIIQDEFNQEKYSFNNVSIIFMRYNMYNVNFYYKNVIEKMHNSLLLNNPFLELSNVETYILEHLNDNTVDFKQMKSKREPIKIECIVSDNIDWDQNKISVTETDINGDKICKTVTAMVYSKGTIIVTGSNSIYKTINTIYKIYDILKTIQYQDVELSPTESLIVDK